MLRFVYKNAPNMDYGKKLLEVIRLRHKDGYRKMVTIGADTTTEFVPNDVLRNQQYLDEELRLQKIISRQNKKLYKNQICF